MTTKTKLKKLKNDVKYFDKNGNIRCSFNQCIDKFIQDEEVHTVYPKWKNYEPVSSMQVFHRCKECGVKVYGKGDKTKTINNYRDTAFFSGKGPATPANQQNTPDHLLPYKK